MDYILLEDYDKAPIKGYKIAYIHHNQVVHIGFEKHLTDKCGQLDDIVACKVVSRRKDFVWVEAHLDHDAVIKSGVFVNRLPNEGTYLWAQIVRTPWPESSSIPGLEKGYRLSPNITSFGTYWKHHPTSSDLDFVWQLRSKYQRLTSQDLNAPEIMRDKRDLEYAYVALKTPPKQLGLFKRSLNQWQRWARDHATPLTIIAASPSLLAIAKQSQSLFDPDGRHEIKQACLHDLPLFETFDAQEHFEECLQAQVHFKGGGSLDIRECPAGIMIDLNTGADTSDAYTFNLRALDAVVQHIVWRHLSGNMLVDFVRIPKGQQQSFTTKVQQAFEHTDVKVIGFCELGLMQLQRKRIRPSLMMTLKHLCGTCYGDGYI